MSKSAEHIVLGRILLVDKDPHLLQMMEIILSYQFDMVTARFAEEGLALVEAEAPFDIAISGFGLPGMNGLEFLRQVGELFPETVRILMSGGFGDEVDIKQAINAGHIRRLVQKPFNLNSFRDQLKKDMNSIRTCGVSG
jgi:response regulator RpfG family c-di-GMP phosphodiesterase